MRVLSPLQLSGASRAQRKGMVHLRTFLLWEPHEFLALTKSHIELIPPKEGIFYFGGKINDR